MIWMSEHIKKVQTRTVFLNGAVLSTFFRTAALLWAAGTANIAAAFLRAALAAADAEEEDQEEGSDDDEQHR